MSPSGAAAEMRKPYIEALNAGDAGDAGSVALERGEKPTTVKRLLQETVRRRNVRIRCSWADSRRAAGVGGRPDGGDGSLDRGKPQQACAKYGCHKRSIRAGHGALLCFPWAFGVSTGVHNARMDSMTDR